MTRLVLMTGQSNAIGQSGVDYNPPANSALYMWDHTAQGFKNNEVIGSSNPLNMKWNSGQILSTNPGLWAADEIQQLTGENVYFGIEAKGAQYLTAWGKHVHITAISNSNPCVISVDNPSDLNNGDVVYIWGVKGVRNSSNGARLNHRYFTLANKNGSDFELSGVNTSASSAYEGGGRAGHTQGCEGFSNLKATAESMVASVTGKDKIDALLIMQGESDGTDDAAAYEYYDNYIAFKAMLRREDWFSVHTPIIFALPVLNELFKTSQHQQFARIHFDEDPATSVVGSEGAETVFTAYWDHMKSNTLKMMGERLAHEYLYKNSRGVGIDAPVDLTPVVRNGFQIKQNGVNVTSTGAQFIPLNTTTLSIGPYCEKTSNMASIKEAGLYDIDFNWYAYGDGSANIYAMTWLEVSTDNGMNWAPFGIPTGNMQSPAVSYPVASGALSRRYNGGPCLIRAMGRKWGTESHTLVCELDIKKVFN